MHVFSCSGQLHNNNKEQFAVTYIMSHKILMVCSGFFFFKAKTEEDEVEDDLEYLRRWAGEPS